MLKYRCPWKWWGARQDILEICARYGVEIASAVMTSGQILWLQHPELLRLVVDCFVRRVAGRWVNVGSRVQFIDADSGELSIAALRGWENVNQQRWMAATRPWRARPSEQTSTNVYYRLQEHACSYVDCDESFSWSFQRHLLHPAVLSRTERGRPTPYLSEDCA